MDNTYAITIEEDYSFTQYEAPAVIKEFVCAVCHGELHEVYAPSESRVLVVCYEHGNICNIGRVTRNTVSIETERSYKNYYKAIHALPDLWAELLDQGFERAHAVRVARENVCEVCGTMLIATLNMTSRKYDVACPRHGSVTICGYVKKEKFIYNFQAIRAWEKAHPRRI